MNKLITNVLAGLYRFSQTAYNEYLIEKYYTYPNLKVGKEVKFFPDAKIPYNVGKIEIGDRTWISGGITIFPHNPQCTVKIGNDCYIGERSRIWSGLGITIGDRVLIAHNVNIFDSTTHPISKTIRYEHELEVKYNGMPQVKYQTIEEAPVIIKDDVWIGCNCIILKGITIGAGSIISAGSVVIKDVPSNVMVAGNPAKVVRKLE